jgi:hypothetical protein
MRYTLSLYRDDMGSYKTNCADNARESAWENALSAVNSARAHDNLQPITVAQLKKCATMKPIYD